MASLHDQAHEWFMKRQAWKQEMHSLSNFDWGSLDRFLDELYEIAQTTPQSSREFIEQQMQMLKGLTLDDADVKTIWSYLNALRQDPINQTIVQQFISGGK